MRQEVKTKESHSRGPGFETLCAYKDRLKSVIVWTPYYSLHLPVKISRHPRVLHTFDVVVEVAIIRIIQFTERPSSYASRTLIPSGPRNQGNLMESIKLFYFLGRGVHMV